MAEIPEDENQTANNIIIAADHGRLDYVTKLLEAGTDPNTVDEVGTSALHNAAKQGHWQIARLLLEKNASPRLEDGHCALPLSLAVRAGHINIVRLLLESDPGVCDTRETKLYYLLQVASALGHAEIIQLLLDYDAPSLLADGKGKLTPLHLAAEKGHHNACDILLKHDKTINRSLWTRLVGPSLQVDSKDYAGDTPLVYAFGKDHVETVDVFLSHYPNLCATCDHFKDPLFHRAIRGRKVEMVRVFLKHGTNVEMKDIYGKQALHAAVGAEDREYSYGRTETEMIEIIQLLLTYGAGAEAKDKEGRIPEFYTRNPKTRMLLRNHAKSNLKADSLVQKAPQASAPPPEYKE